MTAVDRGMFDIVRDNEGITRDDLIAKAKLGPRAGEAIVAVLAASGYLQVIDKKYYLSGKMFRLLIKTISNVL